MENNEQINNTLLKGLYNEDNKYFKFGLEKFGPFLFGFTVWLRNAIENENVEKVFFFARDGFMMEKAYLLLEQSYPLGIESEYVYFSRNSMRRALLWTCDSYEESLKFLTPKLYIPFSEIASYYGIEKTKGIELAKSVGLQWDEDLIYSELKTNQKMKKVYELIKDDIYKESKEQYELIVNYLNQIKIKGKCAIVDIGWHGTMQFYLEQIIKIAKIDAQVIGYYVGTNTSSKVTGRSYGYLYDNRDLSLRKDLLSFFGVSEKFFQSQHGSTKGYKLSKGVIVPVLEKYEYENDSYVNEAIMALQDGSLKYIDDNKCVEFKLENIKDYAKPLIKFGKNPSHSETKLFEFFYNIDGSKVYFLPQKPLYKYKPKEFIHALSNSCWKTGFMKSAFKMPFPYFKVYEVLRK